MKLLFAGEGADDLGGWAGDPAYRPRDELPARGILHALVGRFCTKYHVVEGIEWKRVRKYKAGNHAAPETRTVLGLALKAEELGCDGLVFVRDRDRDDERESDIERGIGLARDRFSGVLLIGGTANEEIEAWLLALLGERGAESHADPKVVLRQKCGVADRDAKIVIVESSDVTRVADDCGSFRRWAERAAALSGQR